MRWKKSTVLWNSPSSFPCLGLVCDWVFIFASTWLEIHHVPDSRNRCVTIHIDELFVGVSKVFDKQKQERNIISFEQNRQKKQTKLDQI